MTTVSEGTHLLFNTVGIFGLKNPGLLQDVSTFHFVFQTRKASNNLGMKMQFLVVPVRMI